MFFNGLLQRKLNSLLRPWLTQDPQFQVNLGFFRSLIIARNLNFDTSVLNALIDSGDELIFLFRSFTIDEIRVRVAHWRAPAFTVEFNGVNVTLFPEKRTWKRVEKSVDDYLQEQKRKIIAEIDSDGSTFHNKIENMIMNASLKSQLKDSLKNLLLMHCCLQLNEVRIGVEYPFSDDMLSFLCYSKELNAQSSNKNLGCLLGGIISLFFIPLRDISFDLKTSKLEIGANNKNHNTSILSCVRPNFGISMKDFHLVNSSLSIQEMNFLFSPTQLQIIGAFNNLLNIECNHVRTGKLLWGIARWKIRHSILPPGCIFYKVALIALLWLRLVKEYQYFLVLVGYSKNEVKVPNNRSLFRLVEQKWRMISQTIETKLPPQAIVSARRVALKRVISQELDVVLSSMNSFSNNFGRIFMPLVFVWWVIVKTFEILRDFFFLCKSTLKVVDHRCCFLLSLGKVSALISCMHDSCPPVRINSKVREKTSRNDMVSFFLLVKGVLFIYEDGISEEYISFTLGFLEVSSLPVFDDSNYDYRSKYGDSSFIGTLKDRPEGSETILSGEPAVLCCHSEEGESGFKFPILEQLSGEMERVWKRMLSKFQGRKGIYDGSPLALCVIHTYRVYPGVKNSDSGFLKCSLMVGKLQLLLKYSSVVSISTLREQVERSFSQRDDSRSRIYPNSIDERVKGQDSSGLNPIMKKMRISILKLLPDKHVEVRAIIAGPCVQICLRNEKLLSSNLKANTPYSQNGLDLIIDVQNIEFAIWPTLEYPRPDGFELELFDLKEPEVEGVFELVNIEYASKGQVTHFCYLRFDGLNVYFEDLVDNRSMQVLLLKPMKAKFSSLRNYLYSFARSTIVSSLSLQAVFLGITGSLYMDELSVILQIVGGLFSDSSMPTANSALYTIQNNTLTSENQSACMGPTNQEMLDGVNNEVALNSESALCFINANFEFTTFDIIVHKSRNGIDRNRISMLFDAYNTRNLGLVELPNSGIWVSIQNTYLNVSFEETKAKANVNFHKIVVTMFNYKNQPGNNEIEVENEVIHSVDRLHEVSLSTYTISLFIDSPKNSHMKDKDHSLLLSIGFDEIFFGTCAIKNGLSLTRSEDKLRFSLSVEREFQSVTTEIQGGLIFIEVKILARFQQCCVSYLEFMKSLFTMDYPNRKSNKTIQDGSNVLGKEHIKGSVQIKTPKSSYKEELLNAFSVNLSQLSLVLLMTDENRVVKEFIGRLNLTSNLWSENRKKKFLFNIHHLDILSRTLSEATRHSERDIRIPRFSTQGSVQGENTTLFSNNASCSSSLDSINSPLDNNSYSTSFIQTSESFETYILERLGTSILAENSISRDDNGLFSSKQGWTGTGSVSGLNLTISLSDIQILFATFESLSGVSNNDTTNDMEDKSLASINQQSEKDLEKALLDGAIVAIQDVHQHMYITVESVENKYKLGGAIHYSLAGKKALFRVKWHKRGIWNFSSSWFSLLSLEGKSDSGIPLRLNYTGSSCFVDLSNTVDNSHALWKLVSNNHEFYEDEVDLDPLTRLSESTFYLINKKNDSGVAFNRGVLEFVEKPGNPFKFKIFDGLMMGPDLRMVESQPHDHMIVDGQDVLDEVVMVPSISLTIEKLSLTLVHELKEPRDKLPLLQISLEPTDVIVQILPHKTRVMSTLNLMLYYFDVHRFIWREFVIPIETLIYYRTTSSMQATKKSNHGIQSHLYFRIEEFDLSLTEILLDMLLYVVGKLDLAGPFAVKNSIVVANSCKVENELDVDLICHFRDNQSARVGQRQSAFLVRHLKEPCEESSANILLENPGISSTSSINVPLSRTQIFAWRTRIISQEDSRTLPGPFIVFNISKNAEEGVSLNISPLLRLHNNTGFPVELRIQRAQSIEAESASVLLREGDAVDDCMAAFDATNLSGGPKKALLSLGVGNFVFSFRPKIKEEDDSTKAFSVEWSENLKGGKAVRLSGVIDKLGYQVRKALLTESWKHSFSTTSCSLRTGDTRLTQMHFLVQSIARDVPIMQPNDCRLSKTSSIALQEQKEIFLLPTVRVSNLLESDIDVLLSETEICTSGGFQNINQATIQHGSTVDLYANPAIIFFNITLAMFDSSCKPVNCNQYLKKLNKKKDGIQFLDIDLEFCGGMYFACLRLIRGNKGMLEASVLTQYTLRNDTDFLLFCAAPHVKPLSRPEAESLSIITPPHFGTLLPPKSTRSWFMKTSKVCMKLMDEESPKSTLDLDALSGLAEIKFSQGQGSGNRYLVKFGISLGPLMSETDIPARMVSFVPRFIVSNDSDEPVFARQCFLEGDFEEEITINSQQKSPLFFKVGTSENRDMTVFNKLLQKHKASENDESFWVQFNPNRTMWGWSGPVCVASLGRFFLKFKRNDELDIERREEDIVWEYASVRVVEEGSSFVLHFHRPPDTSLPYRIENNLHDSSITYYQKDTFQPETLGSGGRVSYVWDDLSRPRKLVVKINGSNMVREINLDKLRPWKSFFRVRKQRELASQLSLETRPSHRRGTNIVQMNGIGMENVGYEVYVDGPTRVLRISNSPIRSNANNKNESCKKIELRISNFTVRLLEPFKQDLPEDADPYDLSTYTPIIIGRLENICFDAIMIGQRKYNQIRVQSVNIDEKWVGAPFAAMLRRHMKSNNSTNDPVLFVVFVLFPTTSTIRDVRYSSIILQPIDLNHDEVTLMKIVPFWRSSLSSNTQSQQYYFDHFEIHPVKITANFLPEDSYSSYSSGQEALRSLLHSVIKIPAIKNLEVELNGVLVTHALVTTRELLLRCARHYAWYGMRAIYIAKGSPLLPPTFASVFDDLASSSLDVFFDPSSHLFNVRGLTLGTFKLISKCIENKGFSGTKRYFGDLSKTFKNAGSNIVFAAVTEVSDSVLKGAESSGFNGMVTGFHHGILRLAMEPSLLGTAFLEGGPDRRIKLDRSPGIDEQYVEGYLQAMLDTVYKQEYLRVRVIDDQVILKNLPPNSTLINEIMERVKDFLVSKALLKGDFSTSSRPLRHLRGENEWRIGPTILTLCQHLFVSFAIRSLRKQTDNAMAKLKLKEKWARKNEGSETSSSDGGTTKGKSIWRWGIGKFFLSAMVAYIDGRLCRCIPNPVARRIVSGFLLSFLDSNDSK